MKKREYDVTFVGCKVRVNDSGETFGIDHTGDSDSPVISTESLTLKEWSEKMPNTIKPGFFEKKDDSRYYFLVDKGGNAKLKKV